MVWATDTRTRPAPEDVIDATSSVVAMAEPGQERWWSLLNEDALIYPGSPAEDFPSASGVEMPPDNMSAGLRDFLDVLRNAMAVDSAFVERLRLWSKQLQQRGIQHFLAREAAKLSCVRSILADERQDALDVLFVVEGDLFKGERTVLPLMRRLRDNFPDMPFDVMVLPASRYVEGFRWGQAPRKLFQRRSWR